MSEGKATPPKMTGGTLDRTPPLELFRTLYTDRTSAQVILAQRTEERTFWFDRGQLVSAASNREAQLVGDLLRTFGLADESVLFAAFERALAEPGRGLGRALSETGAVPRYIADACVRALAERILYDSLAWSAGSYTVTLLEKQPDLPIHFDRSNSSLILEGLRRQAPGTPVPGFAVDPRSRPAFGSDLLLRYQAASVTKEEADLLSRIDGTRTAEELAGDPSVLARFAAVGIIQLVAPGKLVSRKDAAEGLLSLNIEIGGAPPGARAAEQQEQQAILVKNTYRRVDWCTFYELLGVPRDASEEDLNRAIHERARLFHPDHALKTHMEDGRDALELLFRKVRQAEATFRSAENRSAYDLSLESQGNIVSFTESLPTPEIQRQIARANYVRARTLYEEEDYYPAFSMVKQSVEFDPSAPEYWILLSRIQRKNPKWVRQGAETMRRAVQNLPDSVELWFEFSEACAAERNQPERVKALKEVMRLDPANRRAQSALAEIASMKPPGR